MLIRGVANAQPDRVDPVQLAKAEIVLLKAKQQQQQRGPKRYRPRKLPDPRLHAFETASARSIEDEAHCQLVSSGP
jgi:hypothetical protein